MAPYTLKLESWVFAGCLACYVATGILTTSIHDWAASTKSLVGCASGESMYFTGALAGSEELAQCTVMISSSKAQPGKETQRPLFSVMDLQC